MSIVEKIAKKIGKSASEGAVESVKHETREIALRLTPVLVGLGVAVVGWGAFCQSTGRGTPDFSHITINNYYYEEVFRP